MNNSFTSIEDKWKKSKKSIQYSDMNMTSIYEKIGRINSDNIKFYYGTLMILTLTLVVITGFFKFVAPVKDVASIIGAGLMILGLCFRILTELKSISKIKKVQIHENTMQTIEKVIRFHEHRKIIHTIIMPIILLLYTIGFYMITPEFLKYLAVELVILFDAIYLIMIIVLYIQFRKGIKKEMQNIELTFNLKHSVLNNVNT
ncbi:MAG: hypothetical protein HRU50_13930 [Winogradskyella sp.]|uniref:hypothetical protein n=1 Tax=Winogradskyella sp. TaxID=1883156 RepID=UPI0025F576CA|nr:hypothetical protein [Winogradskyella sp.]NRB61025.1 hypothetical protein [Winogradskyella sp.]